MNKPRKYDMEKHDDIIRWFREMEGYLKTEDFIHQGTDLKGREFALDAFHQLKIMFLKEEKKMREIKFRAWDKEEKKMFNPSKVWGIAAAIKQGCELMQYTCLKDSGNKEIYEGDILQLRVRYTLAEDEGKPDRIDVQVIVYFGEYDNKQGYEEQEAGIGFYTKPISGENSQVRPLNGFMKCTTYGNYAMEYRIDVIGNVFENPEYSRRIKYER